MRRRSRSIFKEVAVRWTPGTSGAGGARPDIREAAKRRTLATLGAGGARPMFFQKEI
jgi:hypothetical protein